MSYLARMKSPGQAVIAEKLNLSQSSVSRALRNKGGISREICEKVRDAARELGYRLPSPNDTEPAAEKDGAFVGVLVHSPHRGWIKGGYISGISEVAPELNTTLVLHHVDTADCMNVLDPKFQPPVMRNGLMSAVILVFRWPEEVVAQLAKRYACVSLQHEYQTASIDQIRLDHVQAVQAMMTHLQSLGHRKIGFVGRCGDLSWSRGRFTGYLDSLFQLGLEFSPDRVIQVAASTLERYVEADNHWDQHVEQVIALMKKGVTAFMVASDWAGYCLCRGLLDRGIRVPEDVSLTGFDAMDDTELGCPRLTSIRVPLEEMGAAALRRVLQRQAHPKEPIVQAVFKGTIAEGQTTSRI
jgi:LacI family transcriptional regulator